MLLFQRLCLAGILLSLVSGCSKEPAPLLLIGDWQWIGSSGGISGGITKPNMAERVVLRFSSDGKFSLHQNDTLTYSGLFRVTSGVYYGKDKPQIDLEQVTYSNLPKNPRFVMFGGIITGISNSELSISMNADDGVTSIFSRQR
ncbi:hypothetical protein GO755_23985 [Spirosoma sp. HMF4905]|uniref:Lipocalin-like domain-containing protein n=1 Tax=Spirosoma arboris TaxID=2682092 RepID=A0A7K1SH34_9BACT|nr:hypothetical protein [Spirosoma arboris]MVM33122.1 hypothetical protein [Spirosoma arboris]